MNEQRLNEIEARRRRTIRGHAAGDFYPLLVDDIPALIAAARELQAENARLRCCGNCGRLYLCLPNDGTAICGGWEPRGVADE